MIDKIRKILERVENVSDWIIIKDIRKSTEIFLIKDKVDMNRACNFEEYRVRVFVDFEENIVTCGILEIEFNCDSWAKVNSKNAKFLSYDYPKKVI